jgi:cytochrome c-type biogenesis protein CcmH/NrfG
VLIGGEAAPGGRALPGWSKGASVESNRSRSVEPGHPGARTAVAPARSPAPWRSGLLGALVLCACVAAPAGTLLAQAGEPSATSLEEPVGPPGGWEAMEARLRATILQSPEVAAFHSSLGETLQAQGRTAEARESFAEAVRLEPENAAFHAELGRAQLAAGDWPGAEAAFASAIRLAPDSPALHAGLGEALSQQGRHGEAAETFQRAAALDPANPAYAERAEAAAARRDEGGPGGATPMAFLAWGLTAIAAVLLTAAGAALLLPIAAALLLLALVVPIRLLRAGARGGAPRRRTP